MGSIVVVTRLWAQQLRNSGLIPGNNKKFLSSPKCPAYYSMGITDSFSGRKVVRV
jgi:hypothetical protein